MHPNIDRCILSWINHLASSPAIVILVPRIEYGGCSILNVINYFHQESKNYETGTVCELTLEK